MTKNKTLMIVESPAKAKKIQEFLGDQYIVLACYGHIADLAKGGHHGLGVDIENNFKPRYVLMNDKIDVLDRLIKISKEVDSILISTDADREGAAISWHLHQRLIDVGKPIKRVVFNEIKKDKLLKAIKNAYDLELDINTVHAQEARRILDRIVGFMASPFLMNFFGPKLSAGRVQSVVTKMVIDREREIESFIPEDYWNIHVSLSKDSINGFITKCSVKLTDIKSAENMRLKLGETNAKYIVSHVSAEEEKRMPSAPLITSSLQRIMSRVHNIPADRTMKAAQSLYESGYCTYIRTDSVRVGDESLKEVRDWLLFNNYSIPKKENIFKNKDAAQDAHECIRPSDLQLLPNNMAIIDPDERLVYETIWKYFVASQMMPAVYNTLKITAHIENDKSLEVKASGKALKSSGYLDILEITDDSKIEIPNLNKGDILTLFGDLPVKMDKKQTQPLPRFSEDKLIKELETRNIGRPATYADLLSKISSRNYVDKRGNVFHATDLGKKVTDVLSSYFTFMDYNYTANLEKLLDEIESGKVNRTDMLNKFYPGFKSELNKAYLNYGGVICDKCQNPMFKRTAKASGIEFYMCSTFSKCRNTRSL